MWYLFTIFLIYLSPLLQYLLFSPAFQSVIPVCYPLSICYSLCLSACSQLHTRSLFGCQMVFVISNSLLATLISFLTSFWKLSLLHFLQSTVLTSDGEVPGNKYLQWQKSMVVTFELNSNISNTPKWPMCKLQECSFRQGLHWLLLVPVWRSKFCIAGYSSAAELSTPLMLLASAVAAEQSTGWT